MLTGDKGETAQEIGYSCGLFPRGDSMFEVFKLDEEDGTDIIPLLEKINEIKHENFGFMVAGS